VGAGLSTREQVEEFQTAKELGSQRYECTTVASLGGGGRTLSELDNGIHCVF